jgi:hypothetical protein
MKECGFVLGIILSLASDFLPTVTRHRKLFPTLGIMLTDRVCQHHESELFNALQAQYWLNCCHTLSAAQESIELLKGTKFWIFEVSQVAEEWDDMLGAINTGFMAVMEELDARAYYRFFHLKHDPADWHPICIGTLSGLPGLANNYEGCQVSWFCSDTSRTRALLVAALITRDKDLQVFLGEVLRIQEGMMSVRPENYPYADTYRYSFDHRSSFPKIPNLNTERPSMWELVMQCFKSIEAGFGGIGKPLDIEIECLKGGVLSK